MALKLMYIIDQLGHVEGLARGAVSNYLSSAKRHYTVTMLLLGAPSPAWRSHGQTHPLVAATIAGIPLSTRPPRMILTTEWLRSGFEDCWTNEEWMAICFMYGWMLRIGEGCKPETEHILRWRHVSFYHMEGTEYRRLPMTAIGQVRSDAVDLQFDSRKHQERSRLVPGRTNTGHITALDRGTLEWSGLCMVTLLQGWAIQNHLPSLPLEYWQDRPVLAVPGLNRVVTPLEVSNALKRHARQRGENPDRVVPHCLRHSGITKLANSAVGSATATMLAASGHMHAATLQTYIQPGDHMREAVSLVLQHPT